MRALVDTSALIALVIARDSNALSARKIAGSVRGEDELVGTTAILSEFHSYVLYRRGPDSARRILLALMTDPLYRWLPVTYELVEAATQNWLVRFSDQSFSLTDAISFETMRREKLKRAFAFDRHFETAGFELLDA